MLSKVGILLPHASASEANDESMGPNSEVARGLECIQRYALPASGKGKIPSHWTSAMLQLKLTHSHSAASVRSRQSQSLLLKSESSYRRVL